MPPKLIALDLDGTLLPRCKRITPRARAAVRAALRRGIRVVVATGKTWHLAARYAEQIDARGPVIALNGCFVKDWPGGIVRHSIGVPAHRVAEILGAVSHLDLAPFFSDPEDRLLAHPSLRPHHTGFLDVYATRIDYSDAPLGDLSGDPFFVALLGSPADVREGYHRLEPWGNGGLEVFAANWADHGVAMLVVGPRVDKGMALAAVAAQMGIAREEVVAVGDWRNDRGMIEWAGVGVVMGDADPEVLSVADVVLPADSEADATAAYIEELLAGSPGPAPAAR